MTPAEHAQLLLDKAGEDIHVLAALRDDAAASDAIWGFHAQQAVEKLLKSLLIRLEIRFPFTHRLLELADLLPPHQQTLLTNYESLLDLTPFAVEYRYSALALNPGEPPLDRNSLLTLIIQFKKECSLP